MTLTQMIALYAALTAAHKYILGFDYHGKLYYVTLTFAELVETLKADRAASSKGGVNKVRIRTSKEQRRAFVLSGKAVLIGSIEALNTADKYNKGERFERIITELLTANIWHKDSVPFWQAGDIELNGEQIQIKLDDAELTNEKTLTRAQALAVA